MFIGLLAGGMLADRHDRRTLIMAVQLPQAVSRGAADGQQPARATRQLWPLYVITFGIGLCSGLSAPASTAATPALVGEHQLAAAAALNATASQLGQLGGPAIAGLLIAGPGLASCYAIDAVCFAVFGAGHDRPAGRCRRVTRAQRPGLQSLAEGFRYVRHNGVVGGMLLVDTNAMIFGMPSALFPALASTHFHGGPATFGLLVAAPGLGAMVGAATSGWTGRLRRPGLVVIGAGMVWGAAIAAFGLVGSLPLALFFLALAGMGDLISEVLRNALLQRYTPDQLRGRVSQPVPRPGHRRPCLGQRRGGWGGPARLAGVLRGQRRPGVRGRGAGARRADPGAAQRHPDRAGRRGHLAAAAQQTPPSRQPSPACTGPESARAGRQASTGGSAGRPGGGPPSIRRQERVGVEVVRDQVAEQVQAGLAQRGEAGVRGRLEVAPGECGDVSQERPAELVVLQRAVPARAPDRAAAAAVKERLGRDPARRSPGRDGSRSR